MEDILYSSLSRNPIYTCINVNYNISEILLKLKKDFCHLKNYPTKFVLIPKNSQYHFETLQSFKGSIIFPDYKNNDKVLVWLDRTEDEEKNFLEKNHKKFICWFCHRFAMPVIKVSTVTEIFYYTMKEEKDKKIILDTIQGIYMFLKKFSIQTTSFKSEKENLKNKILKYLSGLENNKTIQRITELIKKFIIFKEFF